MFIDKIHATFMAGKGGNGIASFRRERYIPKGGPSGGDGGLGGSVYLQSSSNYHSLDHISHNSIIKAENGKDGSSSNKKGANGNDILIKVPVGTLVFDQESEELLFDLSEPNQKILLCQGGRYGRGNKAFTTSTRRAPSFHTMGKEGEMKKLILELKSIADVGFIGFPNAGKSTLLNCISKREVKTADYAFTTLTPNLGIAEFDDYSRICFADIPGIIEGASEGKGLGLEFLRHIERCRIYLFVLDASEKDWEKKLQILKKELDQYNPELRKKPYFIALNKADLLSDTSQVKKLKNAYLISAKNQDGILDLVRKIHSTLPQEVLFSS